MLTVRDALERRRKMKNRRIKTGQKDGAEENFVCLLKEGTESEKECKI